MLLLPLITRELGLRSRRVGSYWSRFAVGGAAMLASVPVLLSSGVYNNPGNAGSSVFDTLIAMAFVLCCLTCIISADVISSEKREGTLGLLFLTSVREFDVVLAKLVSSGVAALTALLVLIPFLTLPMLAGGVSGGETFRKALALCNVLFLALAVGIYSSACYVERGRAARYAALILFALTLFPFLVQVFFWAFSSLDVSLARAFSPLGTLIEAGDQDYRSSPGWWAYWVGIVVVHAMGWSFLFCAGKKMRRMLGEERRPIVRRLEPRSFQSVSLQPVPFNSGAWPRPVEWLMRRQRGLRGILWAGVMAGLLYYVFFRALFTYRMGTGTGAFSAVLIWVPNILVGCLSGAFFAWAASRFFVEIRRTGELELLITTPVGARSIVRDQWNTLSEALVLPLIISVFSILLPSVFSTLTRLGAAGGEIVFLAYLFPPLISTLNTVVGTFALCRVGLWFGLKAPGQAAAILWTLAVVKGVPYLLALGWSLVGGAFGLRSFNQFWSLISLIPAVPTLVFYLWIIGVAKRGVLGELSGNSAGMGSFIPFSHARQELASTLQRLRTWKTA